MGMFDRFIERRNAVLEEAAAAAGSAVRVCLQRLSRRFPRHRFSLVQGMGATFIKATPAVLGIDHFDNFEVEGSRIGFDRGAMPDLLEMLQEILTITDELDDFARCGGMEVGNIDIL